MANLVRSLKKFVNMNSEKQAIIMTSVGLLGFLTTSIADLCNILPWQNMTEIIAGVFIAVFGIGCFLMCYVCRNLTQPGAVPLIWGSFGLVGLHSTAVIIDLVTEKFFGISISRIIPYYAYPLLCLGFYGIFRIIAREIKEAWKRA